jgi:lipoprotein-anchoring transpeptidase ErfK/SrfK
LTQGGAWIDISIADQTLALIEPGKANRVYPISTAGNGPGEKTGSECTPRGRHVIRACIGAGQPVNTVFAGRRPTGEIYTPELYNQQPGRDWILTRILWLSGCEPGFNRLGDVDTMRRYIYIHGTPYEQQIGTAVSKGCVRMRNEDIIDLFDRVAAGTAVEIHE